MLRTIRANTSYNSMAKLLHNAVLMNQHKDKEFLQKLIEKKHVSFEGVTDSSNLSKVTSDFFALVDLFEAKYKDLADLDFHFDESRDQFIPYFKVIYPEFTITNSQGRSHVIRDLFIYHGFGWNGTALYPKRLEGGRLSKTELEVLSSYQQSHLGSHRGWPDNPFYCSYFCVGGDTDVSRMMAEFSVDMDMDRYELFLFCVDSMITWESLEGVPFIRMEVISNADSIRANYVNENLAINVIKKIMENRIPLDVDFYISDGVYRIHPNSRASNFIKKIVLENFTFDSYKAIIVSKVPNTFDHYLQMKAANAAATVRTQITASDEYTLFRGRKIYPKIIRQDSRLNVPVSIEDHIVYPKFLENVIRKLESRIYEKAVVKSTTRLHHTISNASRGVTSDTVSV